MSDMVMKSADIKTEDIAPTKLVFQTKINGRQTAIFDWNFAKI